MCMEPRTRHGHAAPPVPIELLQLRSATTVYLAMLRDVDQWAQQAADVNRRVRRQYAAELDGLRDELRFALMPREMGSVASIARVVAELLCEPTE